MKNQNVTKKVNPAELHAELKNEFRQLVQSIQQSDKEETDYWTDIFEKWLDSFELIEEEKLPLHKALVYFMMQRAQCGWSTEQKIMLLNKSVQLIDEYKQANNLDNSNWLIIGTTPGWCLTPQILTECLVYEWLAEVHHNDNIEQTIFWTERALQIIENVYGRNSNEFAFSLERTPLHGETYVEFVKKWANQ